MRFSDKQTTRLLFVIEDVGVIFVSVFLAAYLVGLPTTNVLHSELAFRIPLAIFGTLFLALVLAAVGLAAISEKN